MNAVKVTLKIARRIVVTVVGATVLLVGLVMIVTPGPALVLIPAGLAILGLEFAWARIWLRRVREKISEAGSEQRGERAEEHRGRHTL